ncbi:MAG: GPW/gp25 family protein [Bacteroidales bacterium]|nr:GPW/gp25 family protein [Bacteroidales bacterium]
MNSDNNIAFLGTGWSFPPAFDKVSRSVEMTSGREDIERSLEILLSTRPGERVMQPDYGCNLDRLLFEPMDLALRTYMEEMVKTAILYHEPRITVDAIEIDEREGVQGQITLIVDYTIRTTNSRYNFVYLIEKQ